MDSCMSTRAFVASILFALIGSALATGQTKPKTPPAKTHYKGRLIAKTMHWSGASWLLRKTRESEEHAEELIKALKIREGQAICDLGCGAGYHTLPIAKRVGEKGKVFAVDIQQEMLTMLGGRASIEKVTNIELIKNSATDTGLKPNSCDLILLVDVYHEFSHPEEMLASIRAALKPTGRVALVEFRTEDPNVPIKPEHKMSKAQILKEFTPNGLKLVAEYDQLPWQHVMFFERDERLLLLDRTWQISIGVGEREGKRVLDLRRVPVVVTNVSKRPQVASLERSGEGLRFEVRLPNKNSNAVKIDLSQPKTICRLAPLESEVAIVDLMAIKAAGFANRGVKAFELRVLMGDVSSDWQTFVAARLF